MLLTEDREIIDIYNRKIICENNTVTMANDHMRNIVFAYAKDNQTAFFDKLKTHMQAYGDSGSMFKKQQTIGQLNLDKPVDLLEAIFSYKPKGQNQIVWHNYTSVGGTKDGYYRTEFPFGLFGIRPTNKLDDDTNIELVERSGFVDENSYYPIEATVKVKNNELIDTDIVTIILAGTKVSSIYPGPQANNVNLDKNIKQKLNLGNTSKVKMNNLLEKNLQRRDIGDTLVPFVNIF